MTKCSRVGKYLEVPIYFLVTYYILIYLSYSTITIKWYYSQRYVKLKVFISNNYPWG